MKKLILLTILFTATTNSLLSFPSIKDIWSGTSEKNVEEVSTVPLTHLPPPPRIEKRVVPIQVQTISDQEIINSIWSIIYFVAGLMFIAGIKSYSEAFVTKQINIRSLKKQGKLADGLRVRFDNYQGIIDNFDSSKIKIKLDKNETNNKGGNNFLIVNPSEYLTKTVEIIVANKEDD